MSEAHGDAAARPLADGAGSVRRVLVTGGDGFLGRGVVRALAATPGFEVVSLDVRDVPVGRRATGVSYRRQDGGDARGVDTLREHAIDTVVHLASIVTPGRDSDRAFEHSVDVGGSRNVAEACVAAGVQQIVVSSSGAAYGYHADNPAWLVETDALRGNVAFAYSDHKRQVEELLADLRQRAPQLRQTVLRIGTILGKAVDNQITALFEKKALLAIRGAASPFVFIWDEDVTAIIVRAVTTRTAGIYNVAGDGALGVRELAALLGKPVRELPAGLLRAGLAVGHALRVSRYGPEQLDFLRYRPVLDNARLKREFGYTPVKTSRQAFEAWMRARGLTVHEVAQ